MVIAGRSTDTALTLAPMVYEFGWTGQDWDRLGAGTIAGHIIECGAQTTGGNCQVDWQTIPDMANIGYPIVEARPDGSFVVTKHVRTGGRVTAAVVREQLLYELGAPRTPFLKVSISYAAGWKAVGLPEYAGCKSWVTLDHQADFSEKKGVGRPEALRGGVNLQPHRFQSSDAQQRLVRRLAKDYRGGAHVTVPSEEGHPHVTFDSLPVGQAENAPELPGNFQAHQNFAGHHAVQGSRVNQQFHFR